VSFTAAAGESNNVRAHFVGVPGSESGTWQIADASATLVARGGCTQIDPHTASCPPVAGGRFEGATFELGDGTDALTTDADNTDSGGNVLSADGGPGDDRVAAGSNWSVSLSGGTGNDELSGRTRTGEVSSLFMAGGPGDDRLDGSPSSDRLDGGGGDDELLGRAGDDELTDGDRDGASVERSPGPDRLNGGAGADTLSYDRRTAAVSVDLASGAPAGEGGENDVVVSVESVSGGRGDDRLAGNARSNHLSGGRGADRLISRGGWDWLDAGAGNDVVSCGKSRLDRVNRPRSTTLVAPDCETVSFGDRASYDPYPEQTGRNHLTYQLSCPWPDDAELGPPSSCAGSARLSAASSPHRVLAVAEIPRGPWTGKPLRLGLPLSGAGRRLAARPRGVRAVVRIHFRDGPGRREEPALFAWMIRLKVSRGLHRSDVAGRRHMRQAK
jgi:hypothetical protein